MSVVVGIDPGGRQTGIVLLNDRRIEGATVIEKPPGGGLAEYVADVVAEVRGLVDRHASPTIGVEDLSHPHSHINGKPRVISVDGVIGAAVVLGAILGNWPEAVLVPPGHNGDGPLRSYPKELVGEREVAGRGYRRHCRSAYDVALYAARNAPIAGPIGSAIDSRWKAKGADAGFTLVETIVVLLIMSILMWIAMPLYSGARQGGEDQAAQQTLKAAMVAAADIYGETQTYGALQGLNDPTVSGGCTASSTPFKELHAYDKTTTFTCTPETAYEAHTVVVKAGSLPGGTAGGWVGLAMKADSGTCWQVYVSSTTVTKSGSYSAATSTTCRAPSPTALPSGTSWAT